MQKSPFDSPIDFREIYHCYKKSYDELTITDDYMFEKVMKNESICRRTVEVLLGIKISKIILHETQKQTDIDYESHGVRFDVYLEDETTIFEVEMQTTDEGNIPLRSRYYQSMIDVNSLKKGQKYKQIKSSVVIFICMFDPFKKDECVYTAKTILENYPEVNFNDRRQIKIYNVSAFEKLNAQRDKERRSLMEYFSTKEKGEKPSQLILDIENEIGTARHNQNWRQEYASYRMKMEDVFDVAQKAGFSEGYNSGIKTVAKTMLKEGDDLEKIARIVDLPVDEILKLKEGI